MLRGPRRSRRWVSRSACRSTSIPPPPKKSPNGLSNRRRRKERGSTIRRGGKLSSCESPLEFAAPLLHRSHREPCDESIHDQVVEDRDGDAGDEAAGHERAPEVDVAVDEEGRHADADGEVARGGDEGDGVDELLEHEGEAEDRDGEYAGGRNRHDDLEEGGEAAIAVDHRGLLDVLRDRFEKSHHETVVQGKSV